MSASYKILTFSGEDPGLAPYTSMLYSNFLESLRHGNDWFLAIDSPAYYSTYAKLMRNLLSRPMTQVRLAVITDEIDTCLGWCMTEGQTLHYVYVKGDQRKQGIARSLVPDDLLRVTHLTKIGASIRRTKMPDLIFNPFE